MELEGGARHKEWNSHKLERNPSPGEETGRRGTHSLFFLVLRSLDHGQPPQSQLEKTSHHSATLAFAQDLVTG